MPIAPTSWLAEICMLRKASLGTTRRSAALKLPTAVMVRMPMACEAIETLIGVPSVPAGLARSSTRSLLTSMVAFFGALPLTALMLIGLAGATTSLAVWPLAARMTIVLGLRSLASRRAA
ncbi:hypothetical protein D3C72_1824060 [compost metagenome]